MGKLTTLSEMQLDAIGEIMNISMGSAATAVSELLNAKVWITTPKVTIVQASELNYDRLEPAICVKIEYIKGLSGSNLMILKQDDVQLILNQLMGKPPVISPDFEFDELNISAVSEVMNQMMGASATALSELLGKPVNISTPRSFEITSDEQFKEKYFTEGNHSMVVISFHLKIAGKLESEFLNLMPIGLAKELVLGFFPEGFEGIEGAGEEQTMQEEIPAEQPVYEAQPEAAPDTFGFVMDQTVPDTSSMDTSLMDTPAEQMQAPPEEREIPMQEQSAVPPVTGQDTAQQMYMQPQQTAAVQMDSAALSKELLEMQRIQMELMEQMRQMQAERMERKPKQIRVHSSVQPSLHDESVGEGDPDSNLDLIMNVPVEVSVEMGRTKKLVKDILELNKGSLVVLDKLAGEQVDLFVNGQCIAKGDVVVVDDNFGIRITQILSEDIPVA